MIRNRKPRFVKVVDVWDPNNWWNRKDILGKTFEVVECSMKHGYVTIEYEEGTFMQVPLGVCEINPHLRLVK